VYNPHPDDEVFDFQGRIIYIHPATDDLDYAIAHAVAHLHLGHRPVGNKFNAQQEQDASDVAELNLDGGVDLFEVDFPNDFATRHTEGSPT
jgi:hypothetical protein